MALIVAPRLRYGLVMLLATAWIALSSPFALSQAPALSPELEKVRAALEKYQDPVMAVHDGYFSTLACVEFIPGGPDRVQYGKPGGMGVHFLNPQLIGPVPDPAKPSVLLYEPVGDKLRLAAVEWFVPLATGVKERPKLFGQSFYGPMEGHHPVMPKELHHYDLHVWLFKTNSSGMFNPTNPAVKCPKTGYSHVGPPPKLVPEPKP